MGEQGVQMEKGKFSKRYQRMIEKAEKQHEKDTRANGPEIVHYWPMPMKRSDFRELKRQLRKRLHTLQVKSRDWEWTKNDLEAVEEALQAKNTRRALRWTIAVFIVAVAGVVVTVIFSLNN